MYIPFQSFDLKYEYKTQNNLLYQGMLTVKLDVNSPRITFFDNNAKLSRLVHLDRECHTHPLQDGLDLAAVGKVRAVRPPSHHGYFITKIKGHKALSRSISTIRNYFILLLREHGLLAVFFLKISIFNVLFEPLMFVKVFCTCKCINLFPFQQNIYMHCMAHK